MVDPKVLRAWEEFLDPDVTRTRLIAASIYIVAFEALKDAIVHRLRSFYVSGWDGRGDILDPDYETEVLARKRSVVYASLDWLRESRAITDDDIRAFTRVKACRNKLAHELLQVIASTGLPEDFEQCFSEMTRLLREIETWWIREVEIPTSPDPPPEEALGDILPGSVLALQMLCDIAMAPEGQSRAYLEAFRKLNPLGTK